MLVPFRGLRHLEGTQLVVLVRNLWDITWLGPPRSGKSTTLSAGACAVQFTSTYSSPERSNTCDQRKVDVWAAGCILYELCTGRPLIATRTGTAMYALMARIICDPDWQPPRLPRRDACWQPLLDAALQKDPAERPLPAELLTFDIFACGPFAPNPYVHTRNDVDCACCFQHPVWSRCRFRFSTNPGQPKRGR